MALFGDNEERTEQATTYRREEFRRQGTVALSKELLSVGMLMAVGLTLYFALHSMQNEFSSLAYHYFNFNAAPEISKQTVLDMRTDLAKSWGWMVSPVFIVALLAGIVLCAAQVGFYVTWEPLAPKWERLNPVNGLQRLFSMQGGAEGVKAPIKIGIAGLVVWGYLKARAHEAGIFYSKNTLESTTLMMSDVGKLFASLVFYLALLAILDFAFQKYQLEKQMRMTRQEAKEEFKLREGDPLIKSRIRSVQRRIARRRMMDAVPKAAVIVTNPTHLAIALQYEAKDMAAPKVVAKGAGHIAEKIKEIARAHRIPIVENKPLARTMYKTLNIGQFIPRELYKAVAEVLAYVYKLRGFNRNAA